MRVLIAEDDPISRRLLQACLERAGYGVEILGDAVDLPSFPHPMRAAYVLGPERGQLTPELLARCQHFVRIPTAFSLNVATAGAIIMYDRVRMLGRYAPRPVTEGAEAAPLAPHVQGAPKRRRR